MKVKLPHDAMLTTFIRGMKDSIERAIVRLGYSPHAALSVEVHFGMGLFLGLVR